MMRGTASKAAAINSRVSVFAAVPSNHVQVLQKSPDVVIAAIEKVISRAR